MVFGNYCICVINRRIVFFIIAPNKTAAEGAFLGGIIYGVYDFTNHAILTNYSMALAVMDMVWGAILCGTTTYLFKKMWN